MLPNRSVEKFNQFGYMLVLTMLDNVKEYSSKIPYIHDTAVFWYKDINKNTNSKNEVPKEISKIYLIMLYNVSFLVMFKFWFL